MRNTRLIVYAALLWAGLAGSAWAGYRGAAQRVTKTLALCAVVVVTLAGCAADDPVCRETMLGRGMMNPGGGPAGFVANVLIEIGCDLDRASQEGWAREQEEARKGEEAQEEARKRREVILARAEQGDAEAQFRARTVSSSADEERKWLCLAANQGHSDALFTLGVRKELGDERGERDHVGAYMWYSLAMAQGNEWAANNRARVASKITPEQIAEAEKQAADWQPNPKACENLAAQITPTK